MFLALLIFQCGLPGLLVGAGLLPGGVSSATGCSCSGSSRLPCASAAPGDGPEAGAGCGTPRRCGDPRGRSGLVQPPPSPAEGAATPRLLPRPARICGFYYYFFFSQMNLHSCILYTFVAEDGLSKKTVQKKAVHFSSLNLFVPFPSIFSPFS